MTHGSSSAIGSRRTLPPDTLLLTAYMTSLGECLRLYLTYIGVQSDFKLTIFSSRDLPDSLIIFILKCANHYALVLLLLAFNEYQMRVV